jgi:hypothetical protein
MSSDWLDGIIKHVRDYDASRPRSLQAEPGWSEVGGCRSYLGFRLDGAWASDEPDTWGAIRGTSIHKMLEEILRNEPGFRTEMTTEYRGIPGHADIVTIDETSVSDWKTTKLANSKLWQDKPKSLWEKRVQVHGYAAGLIKAGELPGDAMVRLVVIPVDGTFADWWCWEEPFDRSIADWGADRISEVRERMAAGESLPKDKEYTYCQDWCRFFSICRSADDPREVAPIADPELAAAVEAYGEANIRFAAAKKEKDRLAPMIRGLYGTAGDWRVSMSRAGEDDEAPDDDAIRAHFEAIGEPLPMTIKPAAAPKLSVRRVKKAAT